MAWGCPVDSYWDSKRSKTWYRKMVKSLPNWTEELVRKSARMPPPVIHNKTEGKIELVFDKIRKSLVDGTEESIRHFFCRGYLRVPAN
jgi:hypothetical protein